VHMDRPMFVAIKEKSIAVLLKNFWHAPKIAEPLSKKPFD
jgi:hypothetical protein